MKKNILLLASIISMMGCTNSPNNDRQKEVRQLDFFLQGEWFNTIDTNLYWNFTSTKEVEVIVNSRPSLYNYKLSRQVPPECVNWKDSLVEINLVFSNNDDVHCYEFYMNELNMFGARFLSSTSREMGLWQRKNTIDSADATELLRRSDLIDKILPKEE